MRRCVTCGVAIAARPQNRWAPFCGERCRLIDLGKWLGEEYRVPVAPPQEGDPQELIGGSADEDGDGGSRLH